MNIGREDDDGGMNLVREHALPPFHLKVFYQRKRHRFRIEVSHEDGRCVVDHVDATYEPVLGIDFSDNVAISEKAEDICLWLERGKPVAWFVKDFADGWIYFDNEADAKREVEATGATWLVAYPS